MIFTVTRGQSLRVRFAAVICDFDLPARTDASADEITARLACLLPVDCLSRLRVRDDSHNIPHWVMRLAQAVTGVCGDMNWPAACEATDSRGEVALGYNDALAPQHALRFALAALQSTHTNADSAVMKSRATAALNLQLQRQPKYSSRALMRVAEARSMSRLPGLGRIADLAVRAGLQGMALALCIDPRRFNHRGHAATEQGAK